MKSYVQPELPSNGNERKCQTVAPANSAMRKGPPTYGEAGWLMVRFVTSSRLCTGNPVDVKNAVNLPDRIQDRMQMGRFRHLKGEA